MKKILILALVAISTLNLSCSKSDDMNEQQIENYNIRFENSSDLVYENMKIIFKNDGEFRSEKLGKNAQTFYSNFESFPEISEILLYVNNEDYKLNQSENFRLQDLESGYFTIKIYVKNKENRMLEYSVERDNNSDLE